MRAVVVLPTPRTPVRIQACGMRAGRAAICGVAPSGPGGCGARVARRILLCQRPRMSPRPDLGARPRMSFAASRIVRAAERRTDADALAALEQNANARAYAAGGG